MDDATISKNIAANLQQIADSRGMTRGAVARLLPDESRQSVLRLFRGNCVAKIGLIARVSKSLNVSIDSLVRSPKKKS